MKEKLTKYWEEEPLVLIMGLAILFRLFAAIFAKGWGMLDDHFLVIEPAQSWADHYDSSDWLPGSPGNTGPTGHNFFYPGIHFLLFSILDFLHLRDPQLKMLIVRILHGGFSLLTVWFGYRIVDKTDGRRAARLAGIILAVLWLMPWLSVRNLVEAVCVPFLVMGSWFLVRDLEKEKAFPGLFLAGIFLGLAVNVRYQSVFFPVGVALALLIMRKWKAFAWVSAGSVISFLLVQGILDSIIWHRPFAELYNYITVNIHDRNIYFNLPWYNYFFVIFGMLIPPVSLFLVYGFVREWKRYFVLFLPTLLFFAFHSWFPNKQERFIIPILPFLVMLGSAGYYRYIAGTASGIKYKKWLKGSWIFFWIINLVLLGVFTFTYSKKARVEAMTYLSRYPDIKVYVVVDAKNSPDIMPRFYLQQWPRHYEKSGDTTSMMRLEMLSAAPCDMHPRFVLFTGEQNLPGLVTEARKYFPQLVFETTIDPGFIDNLLHWMNPYNKNKKVYIYRNREFFPEKIGS